MFFLKTFPLLVYGMIIRNRSKGLGTPVGYTVFLLAFFVVIHLLQILAIFAGRVFLSREYRESFVFALLVLLFLLYLLLSTIYNRKKLVKWYVAHKNDPIMKYGPLIVYGYLFFNMALWIILTLYL